MNIEMYSGRLNSKFVTDDNVLVHLILYTLLPPPPQPYYTAVAAAAAAAATIAGKYQLNQSINNIKSNTMRTEIEFEIFKSRS